MPGFQLAPRLTLPVDVAGEAVALLAKRGAGKTNTAKVLAEAMYDVGVQIVALDPVGVWWGLRASAAGRREGLGLPIPVLGGAHGDVPLEPTAGALIADVVVDTGQSLVIDLSAFTTKSAQTKFVSEFADRLYRRKAAEPTLLHLFLEEADEFAPQRPMRDESVMLNRVEALVRRGRSRGIGMTMISQRSASLNKSVLTQADVLIVMRTLGPQDRKAIEAWVESHADKVQAADMLNSLPGLATGEAWVWNPERGILKRAKVNLARTFDSSGTPKAGAAREERKLAPIDLEALGAQITETAERAKENDPKALRAEIARLREEVKRHEAFGPNIVEVEKVVEVSVLTDEDRYLLGKLEVLAPSIDTAINDLTELRAVVDKAVLAAKLEPAPAHALSVPPKRKDAAASVSPPTREVHVTVHNENGSGEIGSAARHFLQTLVRHHPMKLNVSQLGVLARRKTRGGSFNTAMKELREGGFVTDDGGLLIPTERGIDVSGVEVGTPAHPQEVIERWREVLPVAAREVFDFLIGIYPEAAQVETIAQATERQPRGGSWNTALKVLVQSGIVDKQPGNALRASDSLFHGAGVN